MTIAAIATLAGGFILGFLGQRSGFCTVGAIRDYVLIRDTRLLKGLIAFGATAFLAYPIFEVLGGDVALNDPFLAYEASHIATRAVLLAIVGGLGVGVISTLANGCPFRQHILSAQGALSSWSYLAGFYLGALFFHTAIAPLLTRWF